MRLRWAWAGCARIGRKTARSGGVFWPGFRHSAIFSPSTILIGDGDGRPAPAAGWNLRHLLFLHLVNALPNCFLPPRRDAGNLQKRCSVIGCVPAGAGIAAIPWFTALRVNP